MLNSVLRLMAGMWISLAHTGLVWLLASSLLVVSAATAQDARQPELTSLPVVLEFERTFLLSEAAPAFSGATMDLSGKKLLVPVTRHATAWIVDMETKLEEAVQVGNRINRAWIDSETGAVFMHSLPRHIDIVSEQRFNELSDSGNYIQIHTQVLLSKSEKRGELKSSRGKVICTQHGWRYVPLEHFQDDMELHYFPSLEDFRQGAPKWVYQGVSWELQSVRYIASHDVFVVSEPSTVSTDRVIVLDGYGTKVGAFKLPGRFYAVDGVKSGVELFVCRGVRNKGFELCSILINSDLESLGRTNPLYRVAERGPFMDHRNMMFGTRYYRFRGLKEGDVSRFFREVFPSPGYWDFQDLQPVRQELDRELAPISVDFLTSQARYFAEERHIGAQRWSENWRLSSLNQLEAFDHSDVYEISHAMDNAWGDRVFFARSGKGITPALSGGVITDGVIDEDRKIIVTYAITHRDSAQSYKFTVKVLSLAEEDR